MTPAYPDIELVLPTTGILIKITFLSPLANLQQALTYLKTLPTPTNILLLHTLVLTSAILRLMIISP